MAEASIATYSAAGWISVKDQMPRDDVPLYIVVDFTEAAGLRADREHRFITTAVLSDVDRFMSDGEPLTYPGRSFVSHWRLVDALPET